jgi:UDP-3-O-[3-hydroxymyristoyl] glucosamine N-acyltransferase
MRERWNVRRRKYEEFEADNGMMLHYTRHENGGGYVERHATVDPTAYIGDTTYVDRGATIGPRAHIHSGAWIDAGATVHADAVIGSGVHVGRGAVIGRGARIGARSKVGAQTHVWDGVRVDVDETIPVGAVVRRSRTSRHAA